MSSAAKKLFSSMLDMPPIEQHQKNTNEELNQQLERCETYLLNALKINPIQNNKDRARHILSDEFRRIVLNIQVLPSVSGDADLDSNSKEECSGSEEKKPAVKFDENLKESIQKFGKLITFIFEKPESIDSVSLAKHINNTIIIFEKLLLSVVIFDVEIQESLQPAVDFLYKFSHIDPGRIRSVLIGFEFVKQYTEEHDKKFKTEWRIREENIIDAANKGCSIEGFITLILKEYTKSNLNIDEIRVEDINRIRINNVYVRAKLILELSKLQSAIKKDGSPLLGDVSKINEGITILLDGYPVNVKENEVTIQKNVKGHRGVLGNWGYYTSSVNNGNASYDQVKEYVETKIEKSKNKIEVKDSVQTENKQTEENTEKEGEQQERKIGNEIKVEEQTENRSGANDGTGERNEVKKDKDESKDEEREKIKSEKKTGDDETIIYKSGIEGGDESVEENKDENAQKERKDEKKSEDHVSVPLKFMLDFWTQAKNIAEKCPSEVAVGIGIVTLFAIGIGVGVATGGVFPVLSVLAAIGITVGVRLAVDCITCPLMSAMSAGFFGKSATRQRGNMTSGSFSALTPKLGCRDTDL